jgi:RNA polymerase sigma-70 factor (ECF subfamily)
VRTTRDLRATAHGDSRAGGRTLTLSTDSPEALMEAFLNGNVRAFEELYRQLSPRVAAALAHMSGDARLAEDLTQVAFLKLYRARASYQRGTLVMPWVLAIARNTFLDERRHRRRRPESLSCDGTLPEVEAEPRTDLEQSPQKALLELLRALPSSQQEALVLLKVQGLSLAEVASLYGTSIASIKMRVHRAYLSLRAKLPARSLEQDPRVQHRHAARTQGGHGGDL